ncbi:MAG: hypothetical protein DIZ78_17445 [endosymbiont of Escarpia spicata]|uniref:Uncharacterized protein n=1 Tax=endosymbiont of Escarpia spicata TaxID=2200908 RepID=A0A370DBC5_9GAMM|nr:MAG: hypothetical protein DIZ78_17445 [endosymbiont of Escarpia spicata]
MLAMLFLLDRHNNFPGYLELPFFRQFRTEIRPGNTLGSCRLSAWEDLSLGRMLKSFSAIGGEKGVLALFEEGLGGIVFPGESGWGVFPGA